MVKWLRRVTLREKIIEIWLVYNSNFRFKNVCLKKVCIINIYEQVTYLQHSRVYNSKDEIDLKESRQAISLTLVGQLKNVINLGFPSN
jgi:hypothetical protein